jgi:hypothetical protein
MLKESNVLEANRYKSDIKRFIIAGEVLPAQFAKAEISNQVCFCYHHKYVL